MFECDPSWIAGVNWNYEVPTSALDLLESPPLMERSLHHFRCMNIEEYYENMGLMSWNYMRTRNQKTTDNYRRLSEVPNELNDWGFSDTAVSESSVFNINNPHTSKYVMTYKHVVIGTSSSLGVSEVKFGPSNEIHAYAGIMQLVTNGKRNLEINYTESLFDLYEKDSSDVGVLGSDFRSIDDSWYGITNIPIDSNTSSACYPWVEFGRIFDTGS